jgi:D-sedoheptulose 7-phosphate isomerase
MEDIMEYADSITKYISTVIDTLKKLDVTALDRAIKAIAATRERNACVFVFGNGGSAATASHFVCDFNKCINDTLKDKPFRFICLSDNVPTLTAIANDISYDDVFVYQLKKYLTPSDLVIAISGSGKSRNVIKAVEYAKSIGTEVVGISGCDGGQLKALTDYSMHVPINDMQITEDIHMLYDHMMVRALCLRSMCL